MDIDKFIELISKRIINTRFRVNAPIAGNKFIGAIGHYNEIFLGIGDSPDGTLWHMFPTFEPQIKNYIQEFGEESVVAGLRELSRLLSIVAKNHAQKLRKEMKDSERKFKYLDLLARKCKEPKARGKDKKRKKKE